MNHQPNECVTCSWPLDCCTDDGAPKPDPLAVDCPRAHEVWERRLGDARLDLTSRAPIEMSAIEQEDREAVLV